MTQYWAIAVGINQYANLPPLDYAEQDAAALYSYWCREAEFAPARCHLLTPSASSHSPLSPSVFLDTLRQVLRDAAAEDVIWLTFRGYGTQIGGEDYILFEGYDPGDPLDRDSAEPAAGSSDAIATGDLITLVADAEAQPVLLLDLKAADGQADAQMGRSTLSLAEAEGVPVILGHQPDHPSQETFTLGQGLFTAAILESLRDSGTALAQLAEDLTVRLPRLSDRHWRQPQSPMAFVPDGARYQLLTPGKAPLTPPEKAPFTGDPLEGSFETAFDGLEDALPDIDPESDRPETANEPEAEATIGAAPATAPAPKVDLPAMAALERPVVSTTPAPTPQVTPKFPAAASPPPASPSESESWQRLGLWGVALLALLVAGVAVRNRDALFGAAQPPVVIDSASAPNTVARQVNAEILGQAIASLNQERVETPVNQATDFARAIAIAQRIQPGQPLYERSQRYIRRWGNTIIDLAEARAQSGNYVDAIGAARLVPSSIEAVYPRAQKRIQQWQQQLGQGQQRSVLMTAQTLIQPDEASSYSEAIAHLRLVAPRDADYDQARSLIDRWGTNILDLAYRRAYEGQLSSAIAAAMLVPQDAPAYLDAREAIADWQWQLERGASVSEPLEFPGAV